MASVNIEVTVQLTKEEKEILEAAIKLIKKLSDDINSNSDIFADSESVFYCLKGAYEDYDGHLPTIVDIYE